MQLLLSPKFKGPATEGRKKLWRAKEGGGESHENRIYSRWSANREGIQFNEGVNLRKIKDKRSKWKISSCISQILKIWCNCVHFILFWNCSSEIKYKCSSPPFQPMYHDCINKNHCCFNNKWIVHEYTSGEVLEIPHLRERISYHEGSFSLNILWKATQAGQGECQGFKAVEIITKMQW